MDSQINQPELWIQDYPWPESSSHKYSRGTVLIAGGGVECTGAARLAAMAAARVGAGLVAIAAHSTALPVYAAACLSIMVRGYAEPDQLNRLLEQDKYDVLLLGPGQGVTSTTRSAVLAALATAKPTVLDADALTCFADHVESLREALHPAVLLTPHEGEFERLFGVRFNNSLRRTATVVETARHLNCTVLLKGSHTVIARPDGDYRINQNAPATLATAGSGDVLAGLCAGLMALGMDSYQSASMACWLHGEAAARAGYGLIADDLPLLTTMALNRLAPHRKQFSTKPEKTEAPHG